MIPVQGQKTFTSISSQCRAHLERRRSDAILTGIGTVLADKPLFNVRQLPDHADKKRWIAVVSRSGKAAPADWLKQQAELGNQVLSFKSIEEALAELGRLGALRVLVEAGPAISAAIESANLWDERLVFLNEGPEDRMVREFACSQE
jgi:diaminohydroxyphosphoribosylaminopyrimidine deaminase/5-amino-6-(5-phosphoribosylamino)uracil reductase